MSKGGYVVVLLVKYCSTSTTDNYDNPNYKQTYGYFEFKDEEDWRRHERNSYIQLLHAVHEWLKCDFPDEITWTNRAPTTYKELGTKPDTYCIERRYLISFPPIRVHRFK